jgi:hypothetical protein
MSGQSAFQPLELPQKFVIPADENDLKDDGIYFKGYPWVVYSDRMFNKSYTSPGGSESMKNLEFLSAYYVVGRNKQFLHLAKKISSGNESAAQFEDFGWVDMSKLLLWNHCLVKPDNYCNKKAVVIYSDKTKYLFEEDKQEKSTNDGFRILYIYKSFGDKLLLGNSPRLKKDTENVSGSIVDWVDLDLVWVWDEVMTLEPNCQYKNELPEGKATSASVIFKTSGAAKKYIKKGIYTNNEIFWSDDTCRERMPANWLRFPILEEKNNIITVGIFPEYTRINLDGDIKIQPGYCTGEAGQLNSMFNKVFIASQDDLGKIINIYNLFFEKINSSSSFKNVADAWIAILKEERYDQRNVDQSLLTFADINRMLFSSNQSNFLPGSNPIQAMVNIEINNNLDFPAYYNHLIDNLVQLKAILNQKNYEFSFYSYGSIYYWLPAKLLP